MRTFGTTGWLSISDGSIEGDVLCRLHVQLATLQMKATSETHLSLSSLAQMEWASDFSDMLYIVEAGGS